MRQAGVLFSAGLLAMVAQGALASVIPYPWCPDLGLLVVLAIGLSWQPLASGFGLAASLGYVTDALSGSLLGQHALLRLLSFSAARFGSRQLNLRGALPLAVFAFGLTIVYSVALQGLTAFFTGSLSSSGPVLGRTVFHALANAVCAPLVSNSIAWICAVIGDEDTRRGLRIGGKVSE